MWLNHFTEPGVYRWTEERTDINQIVQCIHVLINIKHNPTVWLKTWFHLYVLRRTFGNGRQAKNYKNENRCIHLELNQQPLAFQHDASKHSATLTVNDLLLIFFTLLLKYQSTCVTMQVWNWFNSWHAPRIMVAKR